MGLQTILDAIYASGQAQVREIEAGVQVRAEEILAEAQVEARRLAEQSRKAAAAPALLERARTLQQARFEVLQIIGTARTEWVDAVLLETERRLANVRGEPIYRTVLHRLTKEALAALDGSLQERGQTRLEADPRDRELLEEILDDLGLDLPLDYVLDCHGGLIARSQDGKVMVINTLEVRLERAASHLRCYLATLFQDGQLALDGAEDRRPT